MRTYDVQEIELEVAPARAFALLADPEQLPRWTDAFASADLFVVAKNLLDAAREFLDQYVGIAIGLKTADDAELTAHQIGAKDVSTRRANINTDNATLSRVNVKKRRAAAAADGFTHRAFENQRLGKQFADEKTRDATPQPSLA